MKRNSGITLVGLIITIILLLLLAGITISSLTGSGLFKKAQQAKQEQENTQIQENTTLNEYENWLANYIAGTETTGGGGKPSLTITDTTDTKPSQAMPAEATVLENDASKGIVVADKKGNEWTWVEVPKSTVFKTAQNATDYTNIKTDLINYATDYRKGSASQKYSWTDEYYDGCGVIAIETKTAEQVYTEMYNNMLSSVYTNGGFWISTYEIGDSTATVSNTTRTSDSGASGIAVSKPDQIPYNYVTCSQAQILASGMSTDTNQTSSLLFGIQWDLTCKFIEEKTDLVLSDINSDSFRWGNYENSTLELNRGKYNPSDMARGTWTLYTENTPNWVINMQTSSNRDYDLLLTTGASEDTNKMNIYDFAGNVNEWTLEKTDLTGKYLATERGGYFYNSGSQYPASYRFYSQFDNIYCNKGFRVTLYNK